MKKKYKLLAFVLLLAGILALAAIYISNHSFDVLQPKGHIAAREKSLIIFATLLSLIVVIPVFFMTFYISWKYRASNTKAKYSPEWDGSKIIETIWWGVPIILIGILSVVTWRSSHELDPFQPIDAEAKPMTIQVIALDWKWLFIYPEQNIATVNYVEFPSQTPIDFEITSDAPMNSFWIPQLGGQMYAMSGMSTHLHLMADGDGTYRGSSANISGKGFAGMRFLAKSVGQAEFDKWASQATKSPPLNMDSYDELLKPSENNPVQYYHLAQDDLYNQVVAKYEPYHGHGGIE